MAWFDDLGSFDVFGSMVPNSVGAARSDVEPTAAPYRNESGRLDPNAIKSIVPKGVHDEVDLQLAMDGMRQDAIKNYEPKPLKWNEWLGGVLSSASVPVAYAQGNTSYGQAMLGNTIFEKDRQRRLDYADAGAKAMLGGTDKTLAGIGDSALSYMQGQRQKREAARQLVAKSIAVARARGGEGSALAAVKSGADYLRSLGYKMEAEDLEKGYSQELGGQGSSTANPMANPVIGDQGGQSAPSAMPPAVAPSGQPATPAAPAPAPVPSRAAPPSAGPPFGPSAPGSSASIVDLMSRGADAPLTSPLRETAALVAPYDDETAKLLQKQAENEEAAPIAGAKKLAEEQASARVKAITELPQAQKALEATNGTLDDIDTTINNLLETDKTTGRPLGLKPGALSNIGGFYNMYMINQPGGAAAEAWSDIKKLKNNLGVMTLNAMREASKTGGAVGNVTEKEWPILQGQIAALDPELGEQRFLESLLTIKNRVQAIRTSAQSAYDTMYGRMAPSDRATARTSIGQVQPGQVQASQPHQLQERAHDLPAGSTRLLADGRVVRKGADGAWVQVQDADLKAPSKTRADAVRGGSVYGQ